MAKQGRPNKSGPQANRTNQPRLRTASRISEIITDPWTRMAIGPRAQEADLTAVYERQLKIGYSSTFVTGEGACDAYMKALFPDWRARGVTAVLHEHKGGFAHNLDSVAVDGDTALGFSTGHSLQVMDKLGDALPAGYDHEWTGIAYQQKTAGNTAGLVFAMATLFVFLVLAAQYESLTLPLAIILIVPMCLLAAMAGVNLRGMDNNVLTQIGLVVLDLFVHLIRMQIFDAQTGLGIERRKPLLRLLHLHESHRIDRRHANRPRDPILNPPDLVFDVAKPCEQVPTAVVIQTTGRRQLQRTLRAIDQLRPQALLQQTDRLAGGRLRNVLRRGSLRKTALLGHVAVYLDESQVHVPVVLEILIFGERQYQQD